MAANVSKVSAKISSLETSLDELEAQLEPLFSQTLPESVVGLEKIQQAKLQVVLPYLVYDLVFIYLKTKGLDPKTHPVVAELDRVRKYFDKIKDAEDPEKRKMVVDKGAANRFIKNAIAQVKLGRPPGDEGPSQSQSNVRVPVKVTEKMIARAQYEKELKEAEGDEEEEEVLDVFDGPEIEASPPGSSPQKGKGRMVAADAFSVASKNVAGHKRRRPAPDPFAGYGDEPAPESEERQPKSAKSSPERSDVDMTKDSRPSTPQSSTADAADPTRKKAKKDKQKAKRRESRGSKRSSVSVLDSER